MVSRKPAQVQSRKFQVMSLGPRHKKKEMNIDIMDISINSSLAINLLGVSIDDEQNFSNHMCHL